MAYSADVVRRAQAELAQRREDNMSRYRQRMQEAYERVPRLREIDIQLRLTMAQAAQTVFAQGGDSVAAMEQVKKENLALQQERKILVESQFAPGYLEEAPVCAKCGGSGYLGSTMCHCLREICAKQQKKDLRNLCTGAERFDAFRLDLYSDRVDRNVGVSPRAAMKRTFDRCVDYAKTFQPGAANLLFNGGTGLGKTFLSACIADAVTDKGYSVVYESAPMLFAKLEQDKFSATEQTRAEAEKIAKCDLLIIDDLGTEMAGGFVTAALYALLNQRLLEGKSMIVSTNLLGKEITARYSGQIASRLLGNFKMMPFIGEDLRVMQNR